MGRATRWLKGLLGMMKEKDQTTGNSNSADGNDKKDKKRWSFAKPGKDSDSNQATLTLTPPNITVWLRSYNSESEKEQNKHAIAVAAATAAAADAAVAAAQAAVAVVRLTSKGRRVAMFNGAREIGAAVKIQTFFRGYLARKALRALKGLVKIQALVRGYFVRKRAAATLHSMQALFRAQMSIRTQRARRSFNKENRVCPETRPRKSVHERCGETRSEFNSKRINTPSYEFDENPKIIDIDTYKPTRTRSRRFFTALSECGKDSPYQATSSPLLPCPNARNCIPVFECRHVKDFGWCFMGEECKYSTSQSTPRFGNYLWNDSNEGVKPARSVCGDSFYRPYSNCPNYMSNTQSFKAKLRSLSAPKQRPEGGSKRRLSLNEVMAARNSISSVRMQQSSFRGGEERDEEEEEGFDF